SLATAVCLGNAATINVTSENGNLSDGTYIFTYNLSGINTSGDLDSDITITSGKGSFNIPATLLANAGTTQLTVSSVNNSITGCSTEVGNLSFSFDIALPPDLNEASLSIADFCAESGNKSVNINAPNLSNGTYSLAYSLTGANTATQTATGVDFANGSGSFDLPEAILTNSGETTIMVTAVASATCRTENLVISTSFQINAIPQLKEENLNVESVCLGENSNFSIRGSNLDDGNYTLSYSLSGANSQASTSMTITISNGSAGFIIAANALSQMGTTSLTVESLQNIDTGCQSTSTVSITFELFPIPSIDPENISAMDICFGEAGMLSFSAASRLADGTYTVTYSLSEANNSSSNTAMLTINDGTGILDIPAAQLVSTGSTTITIEEVVSETGCTSEPLAVSTTFEVLPRPDASGLSLNVADICLNTTAMVSVSGATNLSDGEYTITYQLGDSNTHEQTQEVIFSSGETSFTLSPSLLTNAGNTTIAISQLQNFISQCSATNLGDNRISFAVQDPEPPSLMAGGAAFCINDNPTAADLLDRLSPAEGVTLYTSETGDNVVTATTALVNRTTYYASQTNAMGCESSQRLAISVDLTNCDNIFIPEAFSPNGDGVNDRFIIENIDVVYPDYTIEIFNRNGNAVFKGNASSEPWNGNANQHQLGNKILPNGVYFYIINYNDGQTAPKQGNLYLNR
ncbi:MAG TPA: gliding motility-associated C-terminal domain-containing protein, partial [Leeuwenhoekiella sp.]|nr:gliding motility-associated C-terminal domain-containing protein [Leeuwenhoekiella sp.]